jgi:hypothetical protein
VPASRAIGMCKWTNSRVDFDELNLLDRLAPTSYAAVDVSTAPVGLALCGGGLAAVTAISRDG